MAPTLKNFAFTFGGVTHQSNVAGIPQEQLEELVRPYKQLTETQEKLITRLEAELDLNRNQIRTAFDILNEKMFRPSIWVKNSSRSPNN